MVTSLAPTDAKGGSARIMGVFTCAGYEHAVDEVFNCRGDYHRQDVDSQIGGGGSNYGLEPDREDGMTTVKKAPPIQAWKQHAPVINAYRYYFAYLDLYVDKHN